MSIPASFKIRFNARTALWGVWLVLMLALSGFLGFITLSFVEPAPTRDLVGLSQRLQRVRSSAQSAEAAAALDKVASQLFSAQQAIASERKRPWRLRSYDRARGLLRSAERNLDSVLSPLESRAPGNPATP